MSRQTYKVCFCCRRRFKLAVSEAPQEVKALFGKYSENGVMSTNHLHRFLVEEQKEKEATVQDAQAIIDNIRHVIVFHKSGLNLEGFFKYLFGDLNPPLSPKNEVNFCVFGLFFYLVNLILWFICNANGLNSLIIGKYLWV